MEAVRTSETSFHFNVTTRCYIKVHWWWRQYGPLKRRSTSTWLHGATSRCPDYGGSTDLWNVGPLQLDCMVLHQGALMMEAVRTSETSVNINVTTRRSIKVPWWWRQYAPLKRRSTSTWVHGATSQKTHEQETCLATGWTTGQSRFDPRQRQKDFSCTLCFQTGSEAHPASDAMGTGGPFPGAKRGRAWCWPPTSIYCRGQEWGVITPLPPSATMACNGTALLRHTKRLLVSRTEYTLDRQCLRSGNP
jgi:hypothetical protein